MKNNSLLHTIGIAILLGTVSSPLLALDPPIVLDPPVLMDVLSKGGAKPEIRYYGQAAKGGKIDLNATNGFFDGCFQAGDQQPAIPGDSPFIACSFGYLARRGGEEARGTARWHLWCAEAGEIKAEFFVQVPARETNHPWVIKVGDEARPLKVNESDGRSPQKQALTFTVKEPGKVTFTIDCTGNPPAEETRIHRIRLEGFAVNKASLLRVRWRPAAVHQRFYPSDGCQAPKMWVFETKSISRTTSYSPITTPFGYFGTSFNNEGRVSPGAGFNFSMWVAGRNATAAPPMQRLARLIGTGLPEAEYGSFGGEGTGVKFRSAVAYKDGTDRIIQSLRVETKNGLNTFYGYFYDEKEQRWKLYASGQEPQKGKANLETTLGQPGSFCEIPGPPAVQRSGDVVREIKRRGWFFGSDRKWYRARMSDGGTGRDDPPPPGSEEKEDAGGLNSKRVYYMDDYAADGWMAMATGGMENYVTTRKRPAAAGKDAPPPSLPEYLAPEKTAQLFELPVSFGASKASRVASDSATIDYDIEKTGPNSKAILYYGTVDCLTFTRRDIRGGSAVEKEIFGAGRTWQSATPAQAVTAGRNQFRLSGLKGGMTYYYRLFVTHDQGKSWDYQSGSFQTR